MHSRKDAIASNLLVVVWCGTKIVNGNSDLKQTQFHVGHSMSNQQGILGHLSDFDETWCVCSTDGAHYPHQLSTTYIT